jgi:hypothetical protein
MMAPPLDHPQRAQAEHHHDEHGQLLGDGREREGQGRQHHVARILAPEQADGRHHHADDHGGDQQAAGELGHSPLERRPLRPRLRHHRGDPAQRGRLADHRHDRGRATAQQVGPRLQLGALARAGPDLDRLRFPGDEGFVDQELVRLQHASVGRDP